MISRQDELSKVFNVAEYSVDLQATLKLCDDLIDKIKLLESICAELVDMPKGKEPYLWSDYKKKASK